jgi:hypothetical protein
MQSLRFAYMEGIEALLQGIAADIAPDLCQLPSPRVTYS